ncbi:hypothetical protein BJX66DRAFT_337530 [Aspergillus keveii]|uniref:BTB domain-containing protein n=1 Tax=Aspergillus keveii TaxID=714993 RepID=A0ABR4G6U4_9EURO
MPYSKPAAATNQGPGTSPYAGDIVHVYISSTHAEYHTTRRLIEHNPPGLPVVSDGLGHRVTLSDVDESIGHTLLHFIHTGNYETLPLRADRTADGQPTTDELRDEYTNAVLAYHAAKQYNIERLAVWACYHVYVNEQKLAAVDIMPVFCTHWNRVSGDKFIVPQMERILARAFRTSEDVLKDHRSLDLLRGQPEFYRKLNRVMLDLLKRRLDDLGQALPHTQAHCSATAEVAQPQPQCNTSPTVSGMEDLAISGLPFDQKLPPIGSGTIHTVLHVQLPPINAWYNAPGEPENRAANMGEDEEDNGRPADWDSTDSDLHSIMNEHSDTTTEATDMDIDGSDSDRPTDWVSSDSDLYSIMNQDSDPTTVVTETDFTVSDQVMPSDWDTSDSEMFDFLEDKYSDTTSMTSDVDIDHSPATETNGDDSEDADYSSLDEPLGLQPGLVFLLNGDLDTTGLTSTVHPNGEGFLAGPYYRSLEDPFSFMRDLDFLLYDGPETDTSGATPDEDIDGGEEDADYRSLDRPPDPCPVLGFSIACARGSCYRVDQQKDKKKVIHNSLRILDGIFKREFGTAFLSV